MTFSCVGCKYFTPATVNFFACWCKHPAHPKGVLVRKKSDEPRACRVPKNRFEEESD